MSVLTADLDSCHVASHGVVAATLVHDLSILQEHWGHYWVNQSNVEMSQRAAYQVLSECTLVPQVDLSLTASAVVFNH